MGGAITNITAVKHEMAVYDPTVVQGTVLDRAELDRQIELYRVLDADGRRSIVGLQPKRAEVILAGACIVRTVMDKLGQTSLTVSDRGLRHGVLAEQFGRYPGRRVERRRSSRITGLVAPRAIPGRVGDRADPGGASSRCEPVELDPGAGMRVSSPS